MIYNCIPRISPLSLLKKKKKKLQQNQRREKDNFRPRMKTRDRRIATVYESALVGEPTSTRGDSLLRARSCWHLLSRMFFARSPISKFFCEQSKKKREETYNRRKPRYISRENTSFRILHSRETLDFPGCSSKDPIRRSVTHRFCPLVWART